VNQDNSQWQQHVHDFLLNSMEEEKIIEDTEVVSPEMERQVSLQDNNPWIDQSQPCHEDPVPH
jgi:hypothetical protein